MEVVRKLWGNPRLRGETGWVVANKVAEVALMFAAVKVLTNLLGKDGYAEYSIALTSLMLLGNLAIMPMQEAYLRYHYTAEAEGVEAAAGRCVIWWFAIVTLGVSIAAALFTRPLATPLGVGTWTVLASGLVFLGNRWRVFGVQFLDLKRLRRQTAIHNVGFLLVQTALCAVALLVLERSAATALFAYAAVSAVFGFLGVFGYARKVLSAPAGSPSQLMPLVVRFGLPCGALMCFQWIQGFAERYILWYKVDPEAVGLYTAAFTVCGVPYMLSLNGMRALVVPVAYQRAKDAEDPRQLWAGDRVLLLGVAAYLVTGAAGLLLYWFFGAWLLRLVTTADFVLPTATLLVLAGARYVLCFGILIESFFAVHHKMANLLRFRIAGSILVVPICWFGIEWYGIMGAAGGVLLASLLYVVGVCLAPGGCVPLVLAARRGARQT